MNFSSRDQSQYFFDARSDDLIIFNKLQMNPDLMENISRVSGFFEKFHNTEIRVFRPISGLPVVLPKVSCFKRPLSKYTTLSNHCLVGYLTHGSDKNNLIVRDSTILFFFFFYGFLHSPSNGTLHENNSPINRL